jgi:hypothetical protein
MTIWYLDVDRVRIVGANAHGIDVAELRTLVDHAVRSALESAPLPNGRAIRESVEVRVPTLSNGEAIAGAIARGVTRATGGPGHG